MPSAVSRLTSPRATLFPPALGLATAAYSIAIIARPSLFAKPTGLQQEGAPLPTATAIGIRALCGLSYLAAGD